MNLWMQNCNRDRTLSSSNRSKRYRWGWIILFSCVITVISVIPLLLLFHYSHSCSSLPFPLCFSSSSVLFPLTSSFWRSSILTTQQRWLQYTRLDCNAFVFVLLFVRSPFSSRLLLALVHPLLVVALVVVQDRPHVKWRLSMVSRLQSIKYVFWWSSELRGERPRLQAAEETNWLSGEWVALCLSLRPIDLLEIPLAWLCRQLGSREIQRDLDGRRGMNLVSSEWCKQMTKKGWNDQTSRLEILLGWLVGSSF